MKRALEIFTKVLKKLAFASGIFFLICFVLSFTSMPFWMYFRLGTSNAAYNFSPDAVVILSGGGMPGEANLMRLYTTQQLAKKHPNAKVMIAMPDDIIKEKGIASSVRLMINELIYHGVDSSRILLETQGKNTRAQALSILALYPEYKNKNVLVVTSPEHMYRSVASFRKAGFTRVGGQASFESIIKYSSELNESKLGGRDIPGSSIGSSTQFRYQFWNHLRYELLAFREYCAITWYWLRGWI